MMIPAYHLMQQGYLVTVYHDQPDLLQPLFPQAFFSVYPKTSDFEKSFQRYELLLVENDHSERAWTLSRLRDAHKLPSLTFLFPTASKHSYTSQDYLFNNTIPMATNLQHVCQQLLHIQAATKDNGLLLPHGTKHLYPHRVALHPTSKDPRRNWKQTQFVALADKLKALGYTPCFVLNEQEKAPWEPLGAYGYSLFIFSSLSTLSLFLYESLALIGNDSGLGHLASNLGIPTLTLSGNPKRVRLWRPDWALGRVVTPPFPLPNFKGIRWNFREKYWQNFVTVDTVLKNFNKLISTYLQIEGSHDT